MLSTAKSKLQFLLGVILIIVVALAISAYQSGAAARLSKVSATQERARRDAISANWYAAQEQTAAASTLDSQTAYWAVVTEFYKPQANAQRVREANAIRGVAMTQFYKAKLAS